MKSSGRLSIRFLTLGMGLLLLALLSIGLTMQVTRQIDGGGAAVNEAGRLRMQAWRWASAVQGGRSPVEMVAFKHEFESTMTLLEQGDRQRPLFVPWNEQTLAQFAILKKVWQTLPTEHDRTNPTALTQAVEHFVAQVDAMVLAIEQTLASLTTLLKVLQALMMGWALSGALLVLYMSNRLIVHPFLRLREGLKRVEAGDFSARVDAPTADEFGELAAGFNHMSQTLQSLYNGLERTVHEKTRDLQAERSRLAALYEVSSFLVEAHTLDHLAQGFARKIRTLSTADAVAVRWSDEASQRYLMLASDCLPKELVEEERCIEAGLCACGQPQATARTRVIPIIAHDDDRLGHCARVGYTSLISVPIRLQNKVLGEVDLFYRQSTTLSADDQSLFDALAGHLANAVENLRTQALVREAAVSRERAMLASELHDSIAQSLAFLKIQMSLLRQAVHKGHTDQIQKVIDELDAGVRESTNDVRELLVHFRTRTNSDDISQALQTTLNKLEHQSGLQTHLEIRGHALALPSDTQLQVLHIVQEALSNVRKHSNATEVWVTVERDPCWRFTVRDNGQGFTPMPPSPDDTHIGLHIMRERAERIGAQVHVRSAPGQGIEVCLELPPHEPRTR